MLGLLRPAMKILLSVLCVLWAIPLHAEDINVAAASDLNFAIKEIIPEFERDTGHKVRFTLGSSGSFYAQIVNGAPFDVFLSADLDFAARLEKNGRAVPGSTFVYGVGSISLWVRKTSPINLDLRGMQALLDPSVRKIAIANPDHAPYGRAAVAAMQTAKVYDRVKGKLVLGENISQAAQFVESGAADIGIIAISIAASEPMSRMGRHWRIPQNMYPVLDQGAVLLKRAGSGGKAFHEWLRGPGGVFEVEMEVPDRSGGRAALGASADGSGFLRSRCDGPAEPGRTLVRIHCWPRASLHVRRPGCGLSPL
ncbi:MAG: molybdate ABC transporter substrate-binding protein [Acidobacteria bacterium]|nr:molybdate ABC transporter substrate-binding protein [Acidobacteriota bacterium]